MVLKSLEKQSTNNSRFCNCLDTPYKPEYCLLCRILKTVQFEASDKLYEPTSINKHFK